MSTITQVQNYQGSNSFVIKMKDTIKKYGTLTPKQAAAVEKILSVAVEAKQVELTDDMKKSKPTMAQVTLLMTSNLNLKCLVNCLINKYLLR
jgi:hypothetical protein